MLRKINALIEMGDGEPVRELVAKIEALTEGYRNMLRERKGIAKAKDKSASASA